MLYKRLHCVSFITTAWTNYQSLSSTPNGSDKVDILRMMWSIEKVVGGR